MKFTRIFQIVLQVTSVLYTIETKPLFLWKKLCGLYGGYSNPFVTNFPIITININANLTSTVSNQTIIFLNTTPTPFVTLIDPRFQQFGFRQKFEPEDTEQVLTTTPTPFIFGSIQSTPDTEPFAEYDPVPTFPVYQRTVLAKSLSHDSVTLKKDKKTACASVKPACPIKDYRKTTEMSNSQGFLVNGCPCTDFSKISFVLKNVAGK